MTLAPDHGARFVLELDGDPGVAPGAADAAPGGSVTRGRATYRAAVITADARADYRAELADDGTVALTAQGAPAAPEHEEMLAMIAKLTARGAAGRRADGLPPWPARITRWRGPGRGG
jgi:hypothetical protein